MGRDTLPKAICDDCRRKTYVHLLGRVRKIQERLDPGGIVPAGECPHCGALAYLEHSKHLTLTNETQDLLLTAVNKAIQELNDFSKIWDSLSEADKKAAIKRIEKLKKLRYKIKKVRPEI